MQQILEELECIKYLTVMADTSNHKNLKLVPVLVQYFTLEERVQTKVTEFHNLKGCKERSKQCFCQAKDQQFKNEDSGYRMCHPYFA
jgi:hypothetical protein